MQASLKHGSPHKSTCAPGPLVMFAPGLSCSDGWNRRAIIVPTERNHLFNNNPTRVHRRDVLTRNERMVIYDTNFPPKV